MMEWFEENELYCNSDLGFFLCVGLEFGLDKFGQGVGKFFVWGIYLYKDMYNKFIIEFWNGVIIMFFGFWDGK